MGSRSGSADLPLHGGRVPPWLATRMAALGRVIAEAIVHHYGREGFLQRLSHPFWFQSLGCVMGMDWHSSGITTSVLGALKRGLGPVEAELGLYVCGGRGKHSRQTPDELVRVGERTGLDGGALARSSRLVAKVDSCAVQDGFQLYLHGFIVSVDGAWIVIQQGMNPEVKTARRYHWRSEGLADFVDAPHAAIEGVPQGEIINLTDRRARPARSAQLTLVGEGPDCFIRAYRSALAVDAVPRRDVQPQQQPLPHLALPHHHEVTANDVVLRRLHGAIAAAAERSPSNFEELLLTPGFGARSVRALALVAEVIHGTPTRFTDPARFSFAHGGKDGHPFPVPTRVYDETLSVLRAAVQRARLGNDDKLFALQRLDSQSRALEVSASGPDFQTLVDEDWATSHRRGGMMASGPVEAEHSAPKPQSKPRRTRQLELFRSRPR